MQSNHLITQLTYLEAIISLTGDNRIQFLSGDVIGYYNPLNMGYALRHNPSARYQFYIFSGPLSSLNLSSGFRFSLYQPLIQFTLGEYCDCHYFNEYYTLQYDMHMCR